VLNILLRVSGLGNRLSRVVQNLECMPKLSFVVLGKPAPQGSMRAIVVKGKARLISQLKTTMPFRQQAGWSSLTARAEAGYHEVMFGAHVPIFVTCAFYFAPPKKMPKGRKYPAVPPDCDKLCRLILDSMKHVIYTDDGQVVNLMAKKRYGLPERAEVTVESVE